MSESPSRSSTPSLARLSAPEHQPSEYEARGDAAALLIHGCMGTPAEMRRLAEAPAGDGMMTRGILLPGDHFIIRDDRIAWSAVRDLTVSFMPEHGTTGTRAEVWYG